LAKEKNLLENSAIMDRRVASFRDSAWHELFTFRAHPNPSRKPGRG
jgi:hypothetical protein